MFFIENFRVLLGFLDLAISCLDWVVVEFHDDSLECFDCNFEVDSFWNSFSGFRLDGGWNLVCVDILWCVYCNSS